MSNRTYASPATHAQRQYIHRLLETRFVDDRLNLEVMNRLQFGLTDGDCRRLIPLLEDSPEMVEYHDDWYDEYGNDDSPDQGVHQFDGGLGDGSFL